MKLKHYLLILCAALALHGWCQTYSTMTLDFTSRAGLVAMGFNNLPQSSTQVYMMNYEQHYFDNHYVKFYRCGALIDNSLIIFGSEDAATVSGWAAEDGRVEIRPTTNSLRITKVEVFTRSGDGYKIGISDPHNTNPIALSASSSSVTWQDAAASTIIIQAKPDNTGTTTYINQIRVTYADGGQAYTYDVNRDGKVDPDDANAVVSEIYGQNSDYFETKWADLDASNFLDVADYIFVVRYLINTNPMNLDVTQYAGLGDVDGNGYVGDGDLGKIYNFMIGSGVYNDWVCDDPTMDLNGDGKCDAWDYVIIQLLIKAGYTTPAPAIDINEVNFPDANFRAYVLQNIDVNGDAKLQPGEANSVSEIGVSVSDITTLKGIEHFTHLTVLEADGNNLTTIDLSHNTLLQRLFLSDCNLTTLDVSHNTALTTLYCNNNQLSELNVQNNGDLILLYCVLNRLTGLDLSHNTQLRYLNFHGNQIGAEAMDALIASLPQVTPSNYNGQHGSLQPYSERPEHNEGNVFSTRNACDALAKNWIVTYIDDRSSFTEYAIEINEANFPDAGFRQWVGSTTCDTSQDGWLQASEMALTTVSVTGSDIADLTGIEFFPRMQTLTAVGTQLTTIDLSHNPHVAEIYCHHNRLNGDGVDAMIANLPTLPAATGSIYGVWNNHDTMGAETNRFTREQVTAAAAKGWIVKSNENDEWVDYEGDPYIVFESEMTKAAVVAAFDTDGDGELSYAEAAAVTSTGMLKRKLQGANLEEFDEFQYFTGLTGLAQSTFDGNTTLKSIHLPAGISTVPQLAFNGCSALQNVEYDAQSLIVQDQAFYNCSSLASFAFDRVTYIAGYAFGMTALTEVTLPEQVTYVGVNAFDMGNNDISITLLDDYYDVYSGFGYEDGLHMPITNGYSVKPVIRLNRNYFHAAYEIASVNVKNLLHPFIKMDEWANEDVTPFSCDVAVELPQGATIHIVNGLNHIEGDQRALTMQMPGKVVPANTGVMIKLPQRNNYEEKIWLLNQATATAAGDYSANLLLPAPQMGYIDMEEGWVNMAWETMYETEVPITSWRATGDPVWTPGGSAYLHVAASELPEDQIIYQYRVDLDTKSGDVTGDGKVDVSDVNAVINIILKNKTAVDYPGYADVTGDGKLDVSDVNAIINIILKL